MPVLRPSGHEQHRLAEDRLVPGLRNRVVSGDPKHPAVAGGGGGTLLRITGLERDWGEVAGEGGAWNSRRRMAPLLLRRGLEPPRVRAYSNLGRGRRGGKLAYRRSVGIR